DRSRCRLPAQPGAAEGPAGATRARRRDAGRPGLAAFPVRGVAALQCGARGYIPLPPSFAGAERTAGAIRAFVPTLRLRAPGRRLLRVPKSPVLGVRRLDGLDQARTV